MTSFVTNVAKRVESKHGRTSERKDVVGVVARE